MIRDFALVALSSSKWSFSRPSCDYLPLNTKFQFTRLLFKKLSEVILYKISTLASKLHWWIFVDLSYLFDYKLCIWYSLKVITWCEESTHWKKTPDAVKYWRQEEKGMTEDEMVEWHHWLDGHEFEQALGDGDVQRNLACCSPWGYQELGTTERLSWIELRMLYTQ